MPLLRSHRAAQTRNLHFSKMNTRKLRDTGSQLFSDRIWSLDMNGYSSAKRHLFRLVKLVRLVLKEFADNKMGFQCVALSYFCFLALIPLIAIAFVVTSGFGLSDKISVVLFAALPNYPEIVGLLLEKSANIIDAAKSGIVGAFSALMFIWSILWMMFQIERVFNNVWGIQKVPRKLYKRFSFYLIALILLPFIIVIFGFAIVSYADVLSLLGLYEFADIGVITKILGWLGLFIVTALTLSAMYKFIPATHVRYKCAWIAALIAGAVFVLFQYLYLETQTFVNRLNGVYGAIAAVPLFLIWLNYSWQIVIYGASLSFALQNIDTYNIPNDPSFKEAFIEDGRHSRSRRKEEAEEL